MSIDTSNKILEYFDCSDKKAIVTSPLDGCSPVKNKKENLKDSIVIMVRGICTFEDKGKIIVF